MQGIGEVTLLQGGRLLYDVTADHINDLIQSLTLHPDRKKNLKSAILTTVHYIAKSIRTPLSKSLDSVVPITSMATDV